MSPNILYLDFETSGLDPKRHSVLQAAWILERNGEVIEERVFDVQPDKNDDLCLAALDVNGFDLPRCRAGKFMTYVLTVLKQDCLQVSSPRICGHNVQFDISFLMAAADKAHENVFMYLDIKKFLDTAAIARFFDYQGLLSIDRYNLDACCNHFKIINTKAHDALGDIRATRELFHILSKIGSVNEKTWVWFENGVTERELIAVCESLIMLNAKFHLYEESSIDIIGDSCDYFNGIGGKCKHILANLKNCVGMKKEGCPLGKS